jgi:hypothetical protein
MSTKVSGPMCTSPRSPTGDDGGVGWCSRLTSL